MPDEAADQSALRLAAGPAARYDPLMHPPRDSTDADVAIVGGGPAGLMAAIAAAERRRRVTLFEQLDRPGAKLLASGGGRCNLTNTLNESAFMARFGRNGRFMQPALAAMGSKRLRAFFARLGVPTACRDGLHVYPASDSAVTVQSALWRRCRELGVRVLLGARVSDLWLEGGRLAGLVAGPQRFRAGRVVLATGGAGYPDLGGGRSGYDLAARTGHRIVEPSAALAPLRLAQSWPRRCAGVGLAAARVWIDLPGQPRAGVTGELLVTHSGLSGPAVLDLSGQVAVLLRDHNPVPLRVDLSPGVSADQWLARFEEWSVRQGRRIVRVLLSGHLPRRLAEVICEQAGLAPQAPAATLARGQRRALAELLTGLPVTVTATGGFERAMVTRGGVSLKDVDPRTLASRRLGGLFIAGELLDLDGPCGGFNLQWAFASGWLAGSNAAGRDEQE